MADRAASASPLDPSLLGVASLASACSAIVASALGTGAVATLLVAGLAPWITAFISHPGPRRRRRVGAVLLLAGLVHGSRTSLARAASYIRHPRDRQKRRAADWATRRSVVGHGVPRRLSLAGATTIAAVAISAVCLTVPELVFGAAIVADRPLTLLPIAERTLDRPQIGPIASTEGPTLSVPAVELRRQASGTRGARVTYRVVARDASRAPLTPECQPGSGQLFAIGETRVTCMATQANGRSVRRSFTVTVVRVLHPGSARADAEPPRLRTGGDLVRQTTSGGAIRVTFAVSALDAADGALTPSCSPGSGARFPVGTMAVTCTAMDSAGNVGTARFTVTVRRAEHASKGDGAPPDLLLPRTVRAEAPTPLGAIVTYAARAVDARDGAVAVNCAPRSRSRFALGHTNVRCTATDRAGNTARAGFIVVVSLVAIHPDRTDPQIAVPRSVRGRATSPAGAVIRYRASATDDRDGRVAVTCTPPSGSSFPVGATRVRCTARDRAGNIAVRSFTVVVSASDTRKPTDTGKPPVEPNPAPGPGQGDSPGGSDPSPAPDPDRTPPRIGAFRIRTVVAETMNGATVTYTAPTAIDDRDGRVLVECSPASGTWFRVGSRTVRCTAQDKAGNRALRSAVARVVIPPDTDPPRIDAFRIPSVVAETREGAIVRYETPAAIDDRDGPVPVQCSPASGMVFPVGPTPVTCTARDNAGNTATRITTATVHPPPDSESGS